jgi:hypothetical protein
LPEIQWRAGLDLEPIDLSNPDQVAWLETLVWPEHAERLDRLRTAVGIARRDPPRIVRGDLNERLLDVAAEAPPEATLVVYHTAVLAYVPEPGRALFAEQVRRLGARWIAQEYQAERGDGPARYLLSLDGVPLALTAPHGGWARWL